MKNDLKPAKEFSEQLELLKSRNLEISNEEKATEILCRVNYYKLSGYYFQLKQKDSENFVDGTTFEQIYNIYLFNKRLSSLVMDLMETIETSLKTVVANYIGLQYGPLAHLNKNNFRNDYYYDGFIKTLNHMQENILRRMKRSHNKQNDKIFIKHNIDKYGNLPIWVAVEIISFSTISKLYSNLLSHDQKQISKLYYNKVGPQNLENWFFISTNIRNRCAHHSRLYNSYLSSNLKLFKEMKQDGINNKSLFAYFVIVKKILRNDDQWKRFISELEYLISEFEYDIDLNRLAFPSNWLEILKKQ